MFDLLQVTGLLPAAAAPVRQPATKISTNKQATTPHASHAALDEASISGAITFGLLVQAVWIQFLEFV